MGHRLLHQIGKGRQIKPGFAGIIAHEFLSPGFRHRETQFIPADALGLQFKTGGAGKIIRIKPEMACLRFSRIDFKDYIVVNNGGTGCFHLAFLNCGENYTEGAGTIAATQTLNADFARMHADSRMMRI